MRFSSLDGAVTIARALGHPARLRIVAMLRSGELCACQVTEVLRLASSTVSAHLRELRLAGLVRERRDGRWIHFDLTDDPAMRAWIDTSLSGLDPDPQLAADDSLVAELRTLPVEDLCRLGYDQARAKQEAARCRTQPTTT